MQSIENLKEKVFSDCKNDLQEINKIKSQEDLLQQYKSIVNLFEQAQFLKKLSEINLEMPDFSAESKLQIEHLEATNESLKSEYWEILQQKDQEINDLSAKILILENSKIQENAEINKPEIATKQPLENAFVDFNEPIDLPVETENLNESEETLTVEEQIKTIQEKELEERRRKIVEFEKSEKSETEALPVLKEFKEENVLENKFRLGKIKGLSIVKSLFDDDFLEEKEEKHNLDHSLQKANMATDFMEAEKRKQDFRIDLNDKMAFTKLLFHGDEEELKSTINQLNNYKTLDEAKEYLSELYYQNNWKNVDEYAQRLWVLVENKFM